MNYEELLKEIKAQGGDVSEFGYGDISKDEPIGPFKLVDRGGGLDQGSNWYRVYYFENHDVYIKISGYYQSYNGTEFGNWDEAVSEVRPKTKIITVYE